MGFPLVLSGAVLAFIVESASSIGATPSSNSVSCPMPAQIPFPIQESRPIVGDATTLQVSAAAAEEPGCLNWKTDQPQLIAAVWGRFRSAGGEEAVLLRLGAISHLRGIRYWSVTDGRLEELITNAFAIHGAAEPTARADFSPPEMPQGRTLFFVEKDNRLPSPVVYRFTMIERRPGHIVVEFSNESPVRRLFITLFEPGDLRMAFFIDQVHDDAWRCYAVSAYRPRALASLMDNGKSQRNRLLALFGHITDFPDLDLPWVK